MTVPTHWRTRLAYIASDGGVWWIHYDPPPVPYRSADWQAFHDDYDGAPEHSYGPPADWRCVQAGSVQELKREIEIAIEMHEEEE